MILPDIPGVDRKFLDQVELQYRLLFAFAPVVDAVLAADPGLMPDDVMAKALAAKAVLDEHVL